jgi:hypothetical protein
VSSDAQQPAGQTPFGLLVARTPLPRPPRTPAG